MSADFDGPSRTPTEGLEKLDVEAAERIGRYRNRDGVRAVKALSQMADQGPCFSLCAGLAALGLLTRKPDLAEAGARMLASTLLGTAIKSAMKNTISRTRPQVLLDDDFYDVQVDGPTEGNWNSFPSGHTVDAVAAAAAFIRVFPEQRLPAVAVAGALSLVQIPAARHYPLDVAAGTVVGVISEALVNRGANWLKRQVSAERA